MSNVDPDNANIIATNGVLHTVDTVVPFPNVVTFVLADPNFSTLVSALTQDPAFDYVSTLQSSSAAVGAPFTVFTPTNNAFENLLVDLNIDNLSDISTPTLEATLNLHVISGMNVRSSNIANLDGAETLGGVPIMVQEDPLAIIDPNGGENAIIATDVQATNGVIHAVSRVLRDL